MKYIGSVSSFILACLFAMVATTFLYGQPERLPGLAPKADAPSKKLRHFTTFVGIRTARELIGKPVEERTGDTIGRVNDVVVNPRTGRIVFIVLSSGGFLGVGAHLKPVPPQALSLAAAKRGILALDISPKRWKSAPRMNKEWLGNLENINVAEKVYAFYHEPWPSVDGTTFTNHADDPVESPAGHLKLASELIGESVIAPRKGEIGRVSDLTVDLKNPAMARAIIRPTDSEHVPFTVPINAFEGDDAGNALFLNRDARALQNNRTRDAGLQPGKMAEVFSPIIFYFDVRSMSFSP
ncbi:MAG TPA: PRC-barrel domain-containing protein [Verrucomicrobiae bacterium]|nr:PRC-barrel domain-containing protein [Verrucomicrobiae bacterium]